MSKVRVERGPIWTMTIDRPDARNAVDGETAALIGSCIEEFASDSEGKVLIVTGAGGDAFCAGADLKDPQSLMDHPYTEKAGPMGFARLDPDKPTIAAIEGWCVAGGLELAAWCDMRIAGATATFGALNRRWGVPFMDGGTQRFPRLVGWGNALYLMSTGVRFDAAKALQMGFVQEVVEAGQALARARVLAEAIIDFPQSSLRSDRRLAIGTAIDAAIDDERRAGEAVLSDPEMTEGLARFVRGERPETPTA